MAAVDDLNDSTMDTNADADDSAPLSVWIGLTVIAAISFWCQATVTEERFVPALNVISTLFNIPDDVAGATLMAAGASSPELFSSITALFVTHSSLGLGTIVGSEIFNQLIICAGAVWAAKSGKLELDPAILIREVGFYALSIVLLYLALRDVRPYEGDSEEHIFVSFGDAVMVFAGYIAYVWVCAYMDGVVRFFKSMSSAASRIQEAISTTDSSRAGSYGSIGHPSEYSRRISIQDINYDIPFLRETAVTREPEGNFRVVEYMQTKTGERSRRHMVEDELDMSAGGPSLNDSSLRNTSMITKSLRNAASFLGATERMTTRQLEFFLDPKKPSHEHGLYDMEINEFEDRLSCFMWQRSFFYTKAKFATNGWQLRWFTFTSEKVRSVPDRTNAERHRIRYPRIKEIEVDEKRLVIRLIAELKGKRDFILMAPSDVVLEAVVVKLEKMLEENKAERDEDDDLHDEDADDFISGDDFNSLVEFPAAESSMAIIFFLILFPFRFLMHWTIPDVRLLDINGDPKADIFRLGVQGNAFLSIAMCLAWLVVGSYAMVASLEALADLMNIPAAVIGVTVSAAGTSLPNYVASKVAAEKGFGNMAVSNAFGSNTFNIMIGLGLPWLLYTSFGTGFKPYDGLRNEGIVESVLVLAFVLLVFVVIIIASKFTLYQWHGTLFVVLYIAYLVYAIGFM